MPRQEKVMVSVGSLLPSKDGPHTLNATLTLLPEITQIETVKASHLEHGDQKSNDLERVASAFCAH